MLFQNDIPIHVACHRYTLNMQVSSETKNNSSPNVPSCSTVTVSFNGGKVPGGNGYLALSILQFDEYEMNGFSTEEETPGCHNQVCCLLDEDERCTQPAGNASYNKRIQKTVAQKKLKLSIDPNARHIYICEYHKGVIQSIRNKRKRKESEEDNGLNDQDMDIPEVDLYQLQVSALRRYKRHYKIQTRQGVNKAQLAEAWRAVTPLTIQSCFKKSAFPSPNLVDGDDTLTESNAEPSLWEALSEQDLTFEDYVLVDTDIAAWGALSDAEIVALDHNNTESDEDESEELTPVTLSEAKVSLNKLRNFFLQNHVDADILQASFVLEKSIDKTLSRHFKTIPVNEKEAITYFVYMVKNNKNKLDQKNGNETSGT
ncbi:histone deacetylase complex subunit SAP30L [Trichonephila clavipes]|nr:histone deacetylase complex subunit SAP30L [Trichonephila clavipes]